MENRLVPGAGYEIKGIDASGIDRHHLLNNVKTAKDFIHGGREAEQIIQGFKPDVVIGTGGYVTGTVVKHGAKFGAKCFIHEQNAYPGIANRVLESSCEKVFISFPQAAEHFRHQEKIVLSGNPIRAEFLNQENLPHWSKIVLVCGGSLGAEMINKAALEMIKRKPEYTIIFVTGKRYFEDIKKELPDIPENVRLIDYENNMPERMGEADLIVSRSGAITLSEILASGKPAIFIPSPNVTANHQYHNAKSVVDEHAAVLIEESQLSENIGLLADEVDKLLADEKGLSVMAENAKKTAKLDAADIIYDNIFG